MSDKMVLGNLIKACYSDSGLVLSVDDVDRLWFEISELDRRIAELEEAQRWRVVANGELPEENADCLVAFMTDPKYATVCTAYLSGRSKCWEIDGLHYGDVTHWMPAPELPKEREK